MKKMILLVIRLYPAAWRDRYELELQTLMEDVGCHWRDIADVLKGALVMRIIDSSYLKMAGVCGLAGALLFGGYSITLPDRFASEAIVAYSPGKSRIAAMDEVGATAQRVLSRASLRDVIAHQHLYEHDNLDAEAVIERMRRDIRIGSFLTKKDAFELQFIYGDPVRAQSTVAELTSRFLNEQPGFQALVQPSLREHPAAPNRWVIAAWGLAIGVLSGVIGARLRRHA